MNEPKSITTRLPDMFPRSAPWVMPDYLYEIIEEEPEIARELLKLYLETAAEVMEKLAVSTPQHDAKAVSALAHKLKGSTLQLGANDVAEFAGTIETNARQGDWPAICGSVVRLKSMLASLHAEVQIALSSIQSR